MSAVGSGARGALLTCVAGLALYTGSPAPASAAEPEPASRPGAVAAQGSGVGAVLSYREGIGGPLPYFDLRLQITKAGSGSPYEQPVSSRYCPGGCVPEPLGGGPLKSSPLAIADLEGNGQADVVLVLSSGGAHCCTIVQVFEWDPGVMSFEPTAERDVGDPGARLAPLGDGGPPVLESADDRFAYVFAPFAYSGLPLQILAFRAGRFADVTRSFPEMVASDARRQFEGFLANRRQGRGLGLVAAWAADEYLLGHRRLVSATLAREARDGRLRGREHHGPSGRAFVVELLRFLARTGYG